MQFGAIVHAEVVGIVRYPCDLVVRVLRRQGKNSEPVERVPIPVTVVVTGTTTGDCAFHQSCVSDLRWLDHYRPQLLQGLAKPPCIGGGCLNQRAIGHLVNLGKPKRPGMLVRPAGQTNSGLDYPPLIPGDSFDDHYLRNINLDIPRRRSSGQHSPRETPHKGSLMSVVVSSTTSITR